MDQTTSRWLSIGMAFLAGALAGAVVLTMFPGLVGGPAEMPPDPDNPPMATSSAGPSCFDGEVNPNSGWVHEVASGRSYPVTLNATVVHDAGTEVTAEVIPVGDGGYQLALRTVERTPEKTLDCERVRTKLSMAVSLPTSYERFTVTMNDEELVRARRDDTTADLYPLPNPINATSATA